MRANAEPATPAKEKTEPAPVAPKKSVRFAEGTKLAPPPPLERALTIDNLEEGSLFGDVAPPAKRLRIDSPEPESVDDVWAPLDETGDEFGRDVLLSAEDVELIAAL